MENICCENLLDGPSIKEFDTSLDSQNQFTYRICVFKKKLYFNIHGKMYYLNFESDSEKAWEVNTALPFGTRYGQSMTSFSDGIVFFGGMIVYENENIYFNDLWIFDGKDQWNYVTCDIQPRAFHAAAADNIGNLVITGGNDNKSIFDDFWILNLKTQVTLKLDLNLCFTKHTITFLNDSLFCLCGGLCKDSNVNLELFFIDIEKKEKKFVEMDYKNDDLIFSNSCYSFGLLFHAGGVLNPIFNDVSRLKVAIRDVEMFQFSHKAWIPLDLTKFNDFEPYFVFTLEEEPNYFYIVNKFLNSLIKYKVFSDAQTEFNHDSPDFISFLKRNIIYGCQKFKTFESPYSQLVQETNSEIYEIKNRLNNLLLTNNLVVFTDITNTNQEEVNYESMKEIEEYSSKISQMVEHKKEKNRNKKEKEETQNLHKIIDSIFQTKLKYNDVISKLTEEANQLSNEIEIQAIISGTAKYQNKYKITKKALLKAKDIYCKSTQLASKIKTEKEELTKLKEIMDKNYPKYRAVKNKLLTIMDQIWQIEQNNRNQTREIQKIKVYYFSIFDKIFTHRKEILNININENIKSVSYNIVTIPNNLLKINKLLDEKSKCMKEICDSIESLVSTPYGCEEIAMERVIEAIQALENWTFSGVRNLPGGATLKPLVLHRTKKRSTTRTRGKNQPEPRIRNNQSSSITLSPFPISIGRWDVFAKDVERFLGKIDEQIHTKKNNL